MAGHVSGHVEIDQPDSQLDSCGTRKVDETSASWSVRIELDERRG